MNFAEKSRHKKFEIKIGPSIFMVSSRDTPSDLIRHHVIGPRFAGKTFFADWVVRCHDDVSLVNMFDDTPIKRTLLVTDGTYKWTLYGCWVHIHHTTDKCVSFCVDHIEIEEVGN